MTRNPAAPDIWFSGGYGEAVLEQSGRREEQHWECIDGEYRSISAYGWRTSLDHRYRSNFNRSAAFSRCSGKIPHTHERPAMESYFLAIAELSLSVRRWTSSSVIVSTSHII